MKRVFIVLLIAIWIASSSCSDKSNTDESRIQEPIEANEMSRINIPTREHGYSNLQNVVIRSTTELKKYVQSIANQSAWNDKTEFVNALENEQIDFTSMNVLMYFHTEGSGSINVALGFPRQEGKNAVVHITRTVPEMGTTDMAYYGYAFKVNKKIPKVIFVVDEKRVEIKNDNS